MSLNSTTLANDIVTRLEGEFGDPGDSRETWEVMAEIFADAVLDHIRSNAVVTVTITTGTAALQRVSLIDTEAPSSNRQISGVVS